jgi:hypothetical protein
MRTNLHFLSAMSFALISATVSFAADLGGTVRDQSGAAIPRVIAILQSQTDPGRRYILRTDEKGAFRFREIAEGTYSLELLANGFKSKSITATVIGTGEEAVPRGYILELADAPVSCERLATPLLDIRLLPPGERTGNLAGKVIDTRNHPVISATVLLVCPDGQSCGTTKTNRRGEFNFSRLVPRTYKITISRNGFYPSSEPRLAVRENLEIVYSSVLSRCLNSQCDPKFRPGRDSTPLVCW